MKTFLKLILIVLLYLLLIGITGWCLIKSYNLFLADMNEKVTTQTEELKSQINDIQKLQATNPASLKAIQDYDAQHNTNYYRLVLSRSSMRYYGAVGYSPKMSEEFPKEMISVALDGIVSSKEQNISDIENSNKGFWSELPGLSTLLLAGLGVFLTSLITNFGNFCSGLITSFRKWLFGS